MASGVDTEFPYRVRIVNRGLIAATLFADTISDSQMKGCSQHVSSVVAAAKHCSLTPCRFHPFSKHPTEILCLSGRHRGIASLVSFRIVAAHRRGFPQRERASPGFCIAQECTEYGGTGCTGPTWTKLVSIGPSWTNLAKLVVIWLCFAYLERHF